LGSQDQIVFLKTPNHVKIRKKPASLLVNLGTPDSTATGDVRKYLREFLMDGRVIDFPFIPRWMLVNLIIAPFRAPKSAGEYPQTLDGSWIASHVFIPKI